MNTSGAASSDGSVEEEIKGEGLTLDDPNPPAPSPDFFRTGGRIVVPVEPVGPVCRLVRPNAPKHIRLPSPVKKVSFSAPQQHHPISKNTRKSIEEHIAMERMGERMNDLIKRMDAVETQASDHASPLPPPAPPDALRYVQISDDVLLIRTFLDRPTIYWDIPGRLVCCHVMDVLERIDRQVATQGEADRLLRFLARHGVVGSTKEPSMGTDRKEVFLHTMVV